MTIQNYIKDVEKLYQSGNATEHSYRPATRCFSFEPNYRRGQRCTLLSARRQYERVAGTI